MARGAGTPVRNLNQTGWVDGLTRSAAETPERALPADMMLPLLRAVSADGLDARLRRLGLREPFEAFEPLKHHPASRLTFGFRAAGRPLVAKAYKGDASEQAALLQALARHGLAGGRPPTAPPLVAYDAGLRVVVTARLDGVSGPPLFAAGARVAELGADWLARQWAAPIALGRRLDTGAFMSRV